jgi:hypothetical protein
MRHRSALSRAPAFFHAVVTRQPCSNLMRPAWAVRGGKMATPPRRGASIVARGRPKAERPVPKAHTRPACSMQPQGAGGGSSQARQQPRLVKWSWLVKHAAPPFRVVFKKAGGRALDRRQRRKELRSPLPAPSPVQVLTTHLVNRTLRRARRRGAPRPARGFSPFSRPRSLPASGQLAPFPEGVDAAMHFQLAVDALAQLTDEGRANA